MVFASVSFLFLFLPITLAGCCLCPARFRNLFLLVMSIFFYAWGGLKWIPILSLSVLLHGAAARAARRMEKQRNRNVILAAVVLLDVTMLVFFKCRPEKTDMPPGLSFFTFQALSYVIDVMRGEEPQENVAGLALYISFFPQLIAGPIIRYKEIREQLKERRLSLDGMSGGCIRLLGGLTKKVLFADRLAVMTKEIYSNTEASALSPQLLWLAAAAYSLQLYFDFSGYSDMAVGLGAMLGFRFPENFRHPYRARTAGEFWKRWHITLSAWFRDYVYIPLGGGRGGVWSVVRNFFIVWTLTGLWHGAGLPFLLWGLCWGGLILLERYLIRPEERGAAFRFIYRVFLIFWIVFLWTVFHAGSEPGVWQSVPRMLPFAGWRMEAAQKNLLLLWLREQWFYLLVGTALSMDLPRKLRDVFIRKAGPGTTVSFRIGQAFSVAGLIALTGGACLSVSLLLGGSYNPFLYFRF